MKKKIKKLGKVLRCSIFAAMVFIAGLATVLTLKIPGNYKILLVQSGSMEPAIKRMGVVVTKSETEYRKDDIITVAEPANPEVSLTHRIVGVEEKAGQVFYTTKGDANEDADTEKRPKKNVLGKVIFSVPYLGYPVSFAKTQTGLIVMIIIPAVIIVYSELLNIKKEIKNLIDKKKNETTSP